MDPAFTLEKKTAIVVGAANGIGRATVLAFAAASARVASADVEEPGARATAAEIEKSGGQALPVHLDVLLCARGRSRGVWHSRQHDLRRVRSRLDACSGATRTWMRRSG